MLIENEVVNVQRFVEEFNKRFKNFCNKAPIILSYRLINNGVIISKYTQKSMNKNDYENKVIMNYSFDFSKSVKENISIIRDYLRNNFFPTMVEVEKKLVKRTAEELNKMVESKQMKIDDINPFNVVTVQTLWMIEKYIAERNEIIIRNVETNRMKIFHMEIPATIFLKEIDTNIDPIDAWLKFENNSTFVSEI